MRAWLQLATRGSAKLRAWSLFAHAAAPVCAVSCILAFFSSGFLLDNSIRLLLWGIICIPVAALTAYVTFLVQGSKQAAARVICALLIAQSLLILLIAAFGPEQALAILKAEMSEQWHLVALSSFASGAALGSQPISRRCRLCVVATTVLLRVPIKIIILHMRTGDVGPLVLTAGPLCFMPGALVGALPLWQWLNCGQEAILLEEAGELLQGKDRQLRQLRRLTLQAMKDLKREGYSATCATER